LEDEALDEFNLFNWLISLDELLKINAPAQIQLPRAPQSLLRLFGLLGIYLELLRHSLWLKGSFDICYPRG
jgi:hypothetical protein